MALDSQVIPISLNKGLNTKSDPKQVMAGELLTLQNGLFSNPGEIEKRNGFSSLSTLVTNSTPITAGNSLSTFGNSLLLNDNKFLYQYNPTSSKYSFIDNQMGVQINSQTVSGPAYQSAAINSAVCTSAGVQLTVYNTSDAGLTSGDAKVTFVFVDISTGGVIATARDAPALVNYQILVDETHQNFIIIGSANTVSDAFQIVYTIISCSSIPQNISSYTNINLSTTTATSLINPFDAVLVGTSLYTMYANSSSSNAAWVGRYIYDGVGLTLTYVSSVKINDSTSPLQMASFAYDTTNSQLFCTYLEGTNVSVSHTSDTWNLKYRILNLDLTTYLASTTIANPTCGYTSGATITANQNSLCSISSIVNSAGHAIVYVGRINASAPYYSITSKFLIDNIGRTAGVMDNFCYQIAPASKPFFDDDGNLYFLAMNLTDTNTQNTYFLIQDTTPNSTEVTSTINPFRRAILAFGFGITAQYYPSFLTNPTVYNSKIYTALLTEGDTTISSGSIVGIWGSTLYTFTLKAKFYSLEIANEVFFAGGTNKVYDGVTLIDSSFLLYPDQVTVSASSGSLSAGTYSYVITYEYIDNKQNKFRSAPSLPKSGTLGSTGGFSIKVMPYNFASLTSGQNLSSNITVKIYRADPGSTIYYLAASAKNVAGGPMTINDSNVSITGNEQLYTLGGEVENNNPPCFLGITEFKNRIVGISSENPYQWWFSKQVLSNFPAEFSQFLTQNIDQKGGPITALSTMDDKLIFFKSSTIWYVIGDGPSPDGTNNDFTYPQVISSDTGCVNQSSIILTPQGLMFQSPKGIYLLSRGLELIYIGAPVAAYNSYTVTSAKMMPDTTQIRFSLNNSNVLVYDYFVSQWSVFANISAIDSVIYNGKYTYLTSSGVVNVETPGQFVDPGNTPIPLTITTGWLSFANLQGFQRVRELLLLGESESNTNLSVSFSYDFNSTPPFPSSVIPVTGAAIPRQYRVFPQIQKCESIQITITDAPQPTLGEGLRLSALAFEVGSKKGSYKLPSTASYG